jgi:hypothetical protein
MLIKSPTLQAKSASSVTTPAAGEATLFLDQGNSLLTQKDSSGNFAAMVPNSALQLFSPETIYKFESDAEGWTVANGTLTWQATDLGSLLLSDTSAASDCQLISLSYTTLNRTPYVRMRLTRVAGSGWNGALQYSNGGHGFTSSFQKVIAYPGNIAIGETVELEWDMTVLSTGGTDFIDNDADQLAFILSPLADTASQFRIHWIAIGSRNPAQQGFVIFDEGANISGSPGNINAFNFTGAGVTASYGTNLVTINIPGGSGSPGGATGQVQYNNAGAFAGAANVDISSGDLQLAHSGSPTSPDLDTGKFLTQALISGSSAGIAMPFYINSIGQKWRIKFEGRFSAKFQAVSGSAVLTGHYGLLFAATGTATAVSTTTASRYSRTSRVEALVTTAATSAVAGLRVATAQLMTGSGTEEGGYYFRMIGGPATGVGTTTSRFSMGVGPVAAPTDVEPSSITNAIIVGYDAADANVQIMTRGAGAVTKTDTGIAVPTTDRSALYEVQIFQPPGATQYAYIIVTDLIAGTVATKYESNSGNLPAGNTLMSPKLWSSAGGTSSVIGVALHSCEVSSNY